MDTQIKFISGVIEDPRSSLEKSRNYTHDELFNAVAVTWVSKDPSIWKSYSVRDQDGSGSCVAQGSAKVLETFSGVVESAHPIYARRTTTGEGMYLQDAGNILKTLGTTTEALCPSQLMSESQMDKPVTVATPLKISAYAFPSISMDAIAQAFDQFGAMDITFNLSYSEWTDVPVYSPSATIDGGHCVAIIDRFMYKGQKAFLIEDSWGHATSIGNGGQRIITESFLLKRCTGTMYFIPATNIPIPKPAKYDFIAQMGYSNTVKPEVVELQDCLKYLGFFPSGTDSTGKFLSATAHSVIKYQVSKGIMDFATETDMTKVLVGAKTLAALNSDFNK